MEQIEAFRRKLLVWFAKYQRDLPWRRTRDPYAIWISEVMLQQTRVSAVIPFYHRFLARFPTVQTLAAAPESDLLAHWAGLGYYYRARNLQSAAKVIVEEGFPTTYEQIRKLPGIGDYTAAAVASIAFNLPHAVLDGNVFRVLSRLFGDKTNIALTAGKKHFALLAAGVLDAEHAGTFNQAMMELGATVCLPKAPHCLLCPVSAHCKARAEGRAAELPVKIVEKKSVRLERTVFWIERPDELLVWQRPAQSRLMGGFWELPEAEQLPRVISAEIIGEFKHGITFHDYRFRLARAEAPGDLGGCEWKRLEELDKAPVSTIFRKAKRVHQNRNATMRVKSAVSR